MGSVIDEVFDRIVEEVYWVESLEEAEEILASKLELMDEDLREVLLERRRKICGSPAHLSEPLRLQLIAEAEEDPRIKAILEVNSLLSLGYLLQCTPSWQRMGAREKSRYLAPLYRASHAVKLYIKTGDARYLEDARNMVEIALKRAQEDGLIDELNRHAAPILEKAARDAGLGSWDEE